MLLRYSEKLKPVQIGLRSLFRINAANSTRRHITKIGQQVGQNKSAD